MTSSDAEPVLRSTGTGGVRTLTLYRHAQKNAINAPLNDGANVTLREASPNEARARPGNFGTEDSEAYAAFAATRTARFTGRWAMPRSE